LIGFYYMHQSKTTIFNMDSLKIMDEVTKGLDADTVMKQITEWIKEKP
ncbi:MAG TPA: hypothetical protein IAC41_11585, partial [Candidatus Merdenecus merdavium]|nr:hypothetical protein [Candidatus Merdenecus merdavium]